MNGPRHLTAALAGLIVVAGALVTAAYFYLERSIQPRRGEQALPGLARTVEVSFDDWAIPSVFAASEPDLFRAQGFLHASERLWQMELFQRIARGRLAEVFGEPAVDTDRLVLTIGLWDAAGETLETLPTRERALLEAYAAGVNARVDTWRGPWPIEFMLLGIEPRPWSAQASIAIEKIMALDLSGWGTELARADALARLPARLGAVLDPGVPEWSPTLLQDRPTPEGGVRLDPGADSPPPWGAAGEPALAGGSSVRRPDRGWDPVATLAAFGLHASNSWALGGSRTADGHPLLANDMHLALRAPSTWYLNALHAEDTGLSVAGLSIPGAPGVVVGYNRAVAWGFTNAMLDDADFVVEQPGPDGERVRDAEGWAPLEVREVEIPVKGRGEPVVHRVRETPRGPVITDVLSTAGPMLSLLWTGREPIGAATALLRMNRAEDADELRAAAAELRSPHLNLIYASTDGVIGARLVGSIPERGGVDASLPVASGRFPEGWPGFVPGTSMPTVVRPASGYLASANNLQSWDSFGRVGVDYPLPYRARRIVDRLERARGWTVADMLRLQRDTYSLWADRFLPRMIAAARRAGATGVVSALEGWDRSASVGSREAAWFYVWLYRLRERIAADEYRAQGEEPSADAWFPDLAFERVLDDPASPWIDDLSTPAIERLEELEEEAVRTAVREVEDRSWGEVHRERSVHPLGEVAWLDRLFRFHVGPYPVPGGRHTVRPDDYHRWSAVDSTSWTLPILSEYGPSERFVAHLDPVDPTGFFLLPTGQSGNPLDHHYRSMAEEWTEGPLIEISLDRESQTSREESRLRLEPVPGG